MSATRGRTTVDRFVHTLQLRNPRSVKVYTCILNRFERFAAAVPEPLSEDTIRAWLTARLREWPLHLVYHRARLVDRYLEWMVASRALVSNPFTQWRQQYGQRTTTPLVRAVLSLDPAAMERLRPLAPFASFLGERLQAQVTRMQSLGYRYDTDRARLLRFDRFLQRHADLSGQPLRVLFQAWAATASGVHHAWECQACGRAVSKAWHRLDPTVEILRVDRQLARQVSQQHRRPYICTTEDIRRILDAARTFPSPKAPLRPLSLYTMVVLAACAGLRLGELARLTVGDVQVADGTIEIRETKFFKSRRLPLAPSVIAALTTYLEARQHAGAPTQASAGLFWHQQKGGGHYSRVMIEKLLVRVLRRVGLKPARGRAGPRVHDLRHAFVVNRMRTWYHEGVNPQARLPYLATYLGHKDIHSTLVYLTITQDLLQQASERFRHHRSRVRQAAGGSQ
jgi:integrase